MAEIEVDVEEIQDFPKAVDPTQLNFIYGSFTSDMKPVDRLLSLNEEHFSNTSVQFVDDSSHSYHHNHYNHHHNYHQKHYHQNHQRNDKHDKNDQKQHQSDNQ